MANSPGPARDPKASDPRSSAPSFDVPRQSASVGSKLPVPLIGVVVGLVLLGALSQLWTSRSLPISAPIAQGFTRNLRVQAPKIFIFIRDNGDEDGDVVSVKVNGVMVAPQQLLINSYTPVLAVLKKGPNLIEFYGDRDGLGGITLEARIGNDATITDRPFAPGTTASFIIERE